MIPKKSLSEIIANEVNPRPADEAVEGDVITLVEEDVDLSENVATPHELQVTERRRKVWELHLKQAKVYEIASFLHVSERTVHRDLEEIYKELRSQLGNLRAIDLVNDHLHFLDEVERLCMFEAKSATKKTPDTKTGVITRVNSGSDFPKCITAALKAREMKIKLMTDTGIIQKEPERLHHSVAPVKEDKKDTGLHRTEEELIASVTELLLRGRQLPA